MDFSDFYRQVTQQRLVQQQIIQEALYLNQEILLKRSEKVFRALCLYLISQSFTIPIIPIGPWAAWPCLSDFAIAYLGITFLFDKKHLQPTSLSSQRILNFLPIIFLGCLASYLGYLLGSHTGAEKGANFGLFQIYRLLEFFLVFGITTRIPFDQKRITTLRTITTWVFLFVCLGIFLTFFAIVPLTLVGAHLPKSAGAAGPWSYYATPRVGEGWGTIGYNHAYVCAQVILLIGLYLHLTPTHLKRSLRSFTGLYLVIAVIASFLTGSRSGFGVMLLLALTQWIKKPSYIITLLTTLVLGLPFAGLVQWALKSSSQSGDGFILDRQLTIFAAGDRNNLSGRDEIWHHRLDFLEAEPWRWISGSGFGSAVDSGNNAHMLALQITIETGLIGLGIFLFLFGLILLLLYRFESGSRDFLLTTIALLISSVSQETFYPVPALGHFLGFYLCCLAIALRNELTLQPSWLLNIDNLDLLKTPLVTDAEPFIKKDVKRWSG